MMKVPLFAGAIVPALFRAHGTRGALAQALQRSIYVSVLDRAARPSPIWARPTSSSAKTRSPAKFCASRRPPSRCRLRCSSTTARPANIHPRLSRGAASVHQGDRRRRNRRQTSDRHHHARRTADDQHRLHVRPPAGAQRRRADFRHARQRTYLLDGIIETSQGITKTSPTRPVIVAITTEGPELSDRQYMTVLEPLRASGAALNVVTVGTRGTTTRSLGRPRHGHPRDRRAQRRPHDRLGTHQPDEQLADELTHQYRVTYARPDTLIPPEQVTIAAAKPGLTVRGIQMKDHRERER